MRSLFFSIVMGFTLSREYSDAFSRVEDQVIERTKELKLALTEVQQIQIKKDDQARSFAHDIRSPLLALQVLRDLVSKNLADDQRTLLKHTIIRINDLANTVLPKIEGENLTEDSSIFLWPLIDRLVSEKKLEYQYIPDFLIEVRNNSQIFDLCVLANESDLSRILSNLINNSVESGIANRPIRIQISLSVISNAISIEVADNGKGIPRELHRKIFERGFSAGKKDGMGIGLANAKELVESWGGTIDVDSVVGMETRIKIFLPIGKKPSWLTTKLNIKNINDLVIVDDQPYVIDVWKQKLKGYETFRIHWIQNREDWELRKPKGLNFQTTMFLVDHDLSTKKSGLDMISELNLFPNVHLVTANEDDVKLRHQAAQLGISILPKSLIYAVEILT